MGKFKVGDKVSVIHDEHHFGKQGEIIEVRPPIQNRGNGKSLYKVKDVGVLFNEEQLEFASILNEAEDEINALSKRKP